ncbi:glycoside hydrolase family 31 protein [Chaetomium sp. MPI-SDFR-AT-0129]|nr:glycoside hydrolase family 31 protein [Chaetomium sp. MPI-SDFR-AT-0129]
MFTNQDNKLIYTYDNETLQIEAWGPNALRIRATPLSAFSPEPWALLPTPPSTPEPTITIPSPNSTPATLTNGLITASLTPLGKLTISRTGSDPTHLYLEEYTRTRIDVLDPKCSALNIPARSYTTHNSSGRSHATLRLESLDPSEKLFGMGQYQHPLFNLKGADLELAQRNSQASVPFLLSSRGYGFLWNNPSVGRAVLGTNVTSFEAYDSPAAGGLDYWVIAGDTPAAIVEGYAGVTGTVPRMPDFGLGFWQCKLRYQTQEEVLRVAKEYVRRGLKVDVMVVDYFHWALQGEWAFDETYWPDPRGMVEELRGMGMELMVSVWPTVDKRAEGYGEMVEGGLLVRVEKGVRVVMDFQGQTVHFDATNPRAREYVWGKVKENYYDLGIRVFWLDEAEPEYDAYDFENYRYYAGSNLSIGNIYPREYSRGFYEGLKAQGHDDVVNLVRCAWAGSQRYGALVWSGDVASSWSSFRNQLAAGLHMGIAGLPWWTTDIGGFHGGNPDDPAFRELFVRWFQWGAFCPVFRLHGDREPKQPQHGTTGGATCLSGAPNEVWSYGEKVYEICVGYMKLREGLRDYLRGLMDQAHEKGTPVMRPLFYEFPEDKRCWEIGEQYMFGAEYMVCPVLRPGVTKLTVYFPAGAEWAWNDISYAGGTTAEVDAPLERMPVFSRN